MTSSVERRTVATDFEFRTAGDTLHIEGYALKWEARSGLIGGFFKERVAKGATDKTIVEGDIRALVNHDPTLIFGRSRSGTLKLSNDDTGTHYEVEADTRQSYVRDLMVAFERGDVTQSSFNFRKVGPDGDSWDEDEDGFPLRTLHEIQLFDVSPVTYPAYEDSTSGTAKRAIELLAEKRGLPVQEVEDHLLEVIKGEYDTKPAKPPEKRTASGLIVVEDALDLRLRMLDI